MSGRGGRRTPRGNSSNAAASAAKKARQAAQQITDYRQAPKEKFQIKERSSLVEKLQESTKFCVERNAAIADSQRSRPGRYFEEAITLPIEQAPSFSAVVETSLLGALPQNLKVEQGVGKSEQLDALFNSLINAMERDKVKFVAQFPAKAPTNDRGAPLFEAKETSTSLYDFLESETTKSTTPVWHDFDPDDQIYSDSEEESTGANERYPPSVRLLRSVLRQCYRKEKMRGLIGRSVSVFEKTNDLAQAAKDNIESLEKILKGTPTHSYRKDWRIWNRALEFARWNIANYVALSASSHINTNDPASLFQKAFDKKRTWVFTTSLLSRMAAHFPKKKKSEQLDFFVSQSSAYPNVFSPYLWSIDDSRIHKFSKGASGSQKIDVKNLITPLEETDEILFSFNAEQIWTSMLSPNYQYYRFATEFKYWLATFESPVHGLDVDRLYARPRARARRAALNALDKLQPQQQPASTTSSVTAITSMAALSSSGASASVMRTSSQHVMDIHESDPSEDEQEEINRENTLMLHIKNEPWKTSFADAGYGPSALVSRLGQAGGFRINNFDVNRRKEHDVQASHPGIPVAPLLSSSDDEDTALICDHASIRRRIRQISRNPSKLSHGAGGNTTMAKNEKKEDEHINGHPSEATSKYLGIQEERWTRVHAKPRMRGIEPRYSCRRLAPIAYRARGKNPASGAEIEVTCFDQTEFYRRYGHNRLFTDSTGGSEVRTRVFYGVFDHENDKVQLVTGHHCKLSLEKSSSQLLQDWMWKYFVEKISTGNETRQAVRKAIRYQSLKNQNYFVAVDDVQQAEKFREEIVSKQGFENLHYTQIRVSDHLERSKLDKLSKVHLDVLESVGDESKMPLFDISSEEDEDSDSQKHIVNDDDGHRRKVTQNTMERDLLPGSSVDLPIINDDENPFTHKLATELLERAQKQCHHQAVTFGYHQLLNPKIQKKLQTMPSLKTRIQRAISQRHWINVPTYYYKSFQRFANPYHVARVAISERINYENHHLKGH